MNKLKAIKIVVGILTFLLVFLMLSAIGIIIKKAKGPAETINKQVFLNQPAGSDVQNISHNNGLTYVVIKDGGLEPRIVVLNKNNKVVSEIFLNEGK